MTGRTVLAMQNLISKETLNKITGTEAMTVRPVTYNPQSDPNSNPEPESKCYKFILTFNYPKVNGAYFKLIKKPCEGSE